MSLFDHIFFLNVNKDTIIERIEKRKILETLGHHGKVKVKALRNSHNLTDLKRYPNDNTNKFWHKLNQLAELEVKNKAKPEADN